MGWELPRGAERRFLAAQILVDLASRLMQGEVDCLEFPDITKGLQHEEREDGLVHYTHDGTETLRITVRKIV